MVSVIVSGEEIGAKVELADVYQLPIQKPV